jgi:hypothetical protein
VNSKNYVSRKVKTSYNLEWIEYRFKTCLAWLSEEQQRDPVMEIEKGWEHSMCPRIDSGCMLHRGGPSLVVAPGLGC